MSTFAVTREVIGAIYPIEGADRIVRAALGGMDFQFVVAKDAFHVGDPCIYIPVDSILPDHWIQELGLTGKLAGTDHNRVKTISLKGVYSQGIVMKGDRIPADVGDVTSFMGVAKWDPPPNEVKDALLYPLPEHLSTYDIESSDRYRSITDALMDVRVYVTEKMEGENMWICARPDGDILVGMRNNHIVPKDGMDNRFCRLSLPYHDRLRKLAQTLGKTVTLYGEALGPGTNVGNYYKLPEPRVLFFDMKIDHTWVSVDPFLQYSVTLGFPTVPTYACGITLRNWLDGYTVKEKSNGYSVIAPAFLREGIVIRPMEESTDPNIGRLILKQRSPAYLAKSNL